MDIHQVILANEMRVQKTDQSCYRYAFWSCVLLQLWVRPALAHLLPAPIAYYMVKQLSHYTGFTQFLVHKIISLKRLVWAWMEERCSDGRWCSDGDGAQAWEMAEDPPLGLDGG